MSVSASQPALPLCQLTPTRQIDTPIIFAILGGIVAAFYLLKLVTVLEMKKVAMQRQEALGRLKREERPETPQSEVHSVPVTPRSQHGESKDDAWNVTDY
jgi:hypothetical protein